MLFCHLATLDHNLIFVPVENLAAAAVAVVVVAMGLIHLPNLLVKVLIDN